MICNKQPLIPFSYGYPQHEEYCRKHWKVTEITDEPKYTISFQKTFYCNTSLILGDNVSFTSKWVHGITTYCVTIGNSKDKLKSTNIRELSQLVYERLEKEIDLENGMFTKIHVEVTRIVFNKGWVDMFTCDDPVFQDDVRIFAIQTTIDTSENTRGLEPSHSMREIVTGLEPGQPATPPYLKYFGTNLNLQPIIIPFDGSFEPEYK